MRNPAEAQNVSEGDFSCPLTGWGCAAGAGMLPAVLHYCMMHTHHTTAISLSYPSPWTHEITPRRQESLAGTYTSTSLPATTAMLMHSTSSAFLGRSPAYS